PSIIIDITYGRGMTISFKYYSRLVRNIMKYGMSQMGVHVIAIQPASVWSSSLVVAMYKNRGVISVRGFIDGKVHIKIAIIVIIKKTCHGRLYVNIQAIFCSHIPEMRNSVFIYSLINI